MAKQVEVLVAFTNPIYWQLALKGNIAIQGNKAPDATYIAFLRTGLNRKIKSAITHIGKVDYVQSDMAFPSICQRYHLPIEKFPQSHVASDKPVKCYRLNKLGIVRLAREIPYLTGEKKNEVYFFTTCSELLRVKSVGEIKTIHQLGLD